MPDAYSWVPCLPYGPDVDERTYDASNPEDLPLPFPCCMSSYNFGGSIIYTKAGAFSANSNYHIKSVNIIGSNASFSLMVAWKSSDTVHYNVEFASASASTRVTVPETYPKPSSSSSYEHFTSSYGYVINYAFSSFGGYSGGSMYYNNIPSYSTLEEALSAIDDNVWSLAPPQYPIQYQQTNCTLSGPDEAAIGDTVTVSCTFPEGYGIANPSSSILVTNNGVAVDYTYSNGVITFTMPDPT